jgi:hypothetical protein
MTQGNASWLVKCRVEPGMFKQDWLVYVDAVDPKNERQSAKVQLFADAREVVDVQGKPRRNEPAPAWLRVSLVAGRGELTNIILPRPAAPFGEHIVVRTEALKEVGGA